MASLKAKKGNPFERKIAYNLIIFNYNVIRLDDNTKGIDLLVKNPTNEKLLFAVECKFHKHFSWNELVNIYKKTEYNSKKYLKDYIPLLVFKSNRQPPLVMHKVESSYFVQEFTSFFKCTFVSIPKGYKLWQI